MDKQVEAMLRGGKFRKILESCIIVFREKYDLKKTEVEVLYYFANADQKDTAKDVTNYLQMNKGHISTTLDGLCKKQLLVSNQDNIDRRIVHYEATDKAGMIIREIKSVVTQLNKDLFEGVSIEDRKALERIATQIAQNIDRIEREM